MELCSQRKFYQTTRKSSCVNARGILPAAYQVLAVMLCLLGRGVLTLAGRGVSTLTRGIPTHTLAKVGTLLIDWKVGTLHQLEGRYHPISWKVGTPWV